MAYFSVDDVCGLIDRFSVQSSQSVYQFYTSAVVPLSSIFLKWGSLTLPVLFFLLTVAGVV